MESFDLAERFNKLESQITHLEYTCEQLNEVVVAQQKVIMRLRTELDRLSHSMQTIEIERISANNQKPPHYQ